MTEYVGKSVFEGIAIGKLKIVKHDEAATVIEKGTPAAALIADELAKEADFFSIGSNDLTQYTLAADRQNQELENIIDVHHKSVLRLIKYAADCAHKEGKWIGVCGELARDLTLTEFFVSCCIDELSVSPPYVLALREKIRSLSAKDICAETFIK